VVDDPHAQSSLWDEAARELGLAVADRPDRFGGSNGRLTGVVDGLRVDVRKQRRGEGMATGISVQFPQAIGPTGLEFKRIRKHYRGRPATGRPTRFGWYVYTGSRARRAVLARADDSQELALWMTPMRIDALCDLAQMGRDVLVTRKRVVTYRGGLGGTASSAAIIDEVRRVLPLARRLI
jgi:hypothetical protein